MKCIVLCALLTVVAAGTIEYFTSGNEHLDMDALIADPDEMKAYVDCFIDKAPCTELTESYKYIARHSIKDSCRRCTDNQKYMYGRFLQELKKTYPESYQAYRNHYDPQNEHFDALESELFKHPKPSSD